MIDKKQIERAMKATLDNAEDFLRDSRKLQELGCIGHATSLAILGFEEAHKAYLISFFHPLFDGVIGEDYRNDLRKKLRNHTWKQLLAKEFRAGLEYVLADSELFADEKQMLELPSLSETKSSTEFAFAEKLDRIKNDGLYTDPFRDPIWYPSATRAKTLEEAQNLLMTQIKFVKGYVRQFSLLNLVPERIVKSVKNELSKIISTISSFQGEGVPNTNIIERKLSVFGESGKLVASVVKSYLNSEQMRKLQNEKERIKQQKGPD